MSWQDVQWEHLQYEATSLDLPTPEPMTPHPLPPYADKNAYTRHHLQLRAASVGSALSFMIGLILLLSGGRIAAIIFGVLWLLLLIVYFVIKTSLERKEQQYVQAEQRWLDWERRAYKAGLTPQQRRLLDRLLHPEQQGVNPANIAPKVRTTREISVRAQQQESE